MTRVAALRGLAGAIDPHGVNYLRGRDESIPMASIDQEHADRLTMERLGDSRSVVIYLVVQESPTIHRDHGRGALIERRAFDLEAGAYFAGSQVGYGERLLRSLIP